MLIAVIIFLVIYVVIATEKLPRHWVALSGGAALLVFGILSPLEAFNYINWDTIGLLTGMFVLVAILTEAGFFKWLAMTAVRKVNYHPASLFIILILMSALMATVMDSITVMLFMAALTLQFCLLLKLDPVPIIIGEVCAANTGGAATLVGDPPNVILGTTLGLNFQDFATHTGPISLCAALILLGFFYFVNRKSLRDAHEALDEKTIAEIERLHNEPVHAHLTRVGLVGFCVAVTLLVMHHLISDVTGLPFSGAVAAMLPAVGALIAIGPSEIKPVIKRVDVESLAFFAGLFILIGGLEKVNLFEMFATSLAKLTINNHSGLVLALHWVPGMASGVVDNVPLALAMSYVVGDLAKLPGMPALSLMVWSLALGIDIGGNLTPIGASANVVAYTFLEKNHSHVGWKRWILIAAPPTLFVMVVASALLMAKGSIGWY